MRADIMPRREFLKRAAAAAASAAALRTLGADLNSEPAPASAPTAGAGTRRPNIVFVFSDEHRWCSLPFTEMPELRAPNLERLAREGIRFDHCISNNPICTPMRGMLLTGLWPHRSTCVSNDWFGDHEIIGVKSPTIAHTFKTAGYTTGYIGKWHLGEENVRNTGFDFFRHWLYGDNHWETKTRDVPSGEDYRIAKGYNATLMTDEALEFINAHAGDDKPFLLMLSLNPPHWRWDDAPEEFVNLYPEGRLPFRPNVTEERYKRDKELLYYRHYHAHISAVDREIGRVLNALERLGIAGNTVLIYTSDHGSSFGSNGVGSKANPFDESIRVPFLARWPGRIAAGAVSDRLLGSIDLYPTLCGLAGLPRPAHCDGQDFSGAVLGRGGPDPATQLIHVVNFQRNYYRSVLDPNMPNIFHPFRGVRSKRYTFTVGAGGDWQLFDNREDPFQQRNLVDDPAYAGIKEELRRELDRWLALSEDPFIAAEWRTLPLPERIARQNRHYSLLPFRAEWEQYKADALAPRLAVAPPEREAALRTAADRVFDEDFFGRYKALTVEIEGKRPQTKIPAETLRARLAALEQQAAARFAAECARAQAGG
mgnify:CR=1 FL=1